MERGDPRPPRDRRGSPRLNPGEFGILPLPDAAPGTLFSRTAGLTTLDISFAYAKNPLGEDEMVALALDPGHTGRTGDETPSEASGPKFTCEVLGRTEAGINLHIEVSAVHQGEITAAVEAMTRNASRLGTETDSVVEVRVSRREPCTQVDCGLVSAVEKTLRANGYETREAVLWERGSAASSTGAFAVGTGGDDEVLRLARSTLNSRTTA